MLVQKYTSQVTREQIDTTKNPWLNSKNEKFKNLSTPQAKGRVGVLLYKHFLEKLCGKKVRMVNDQGDIEFLNSSGEWVKDEVKTASATLKYRKKDKNFTKEHWFNQIRPNQESWNGVVLIAIFPTYFQIYRMDRDEYFSNRAVRAAGITPGHTGTDDLDQVKLVDNLCKNSYNEWELIYEGA